MLSPTHSQREGDEESAAAGWARKAPKRAVERAVGRKKIHKERFGVYRQVLGSVNHDTGVTFWHLPK